LLLAIVMISLLGCTSSLVDNNREDEVAHGLKLKLDLPEQLLADVEAKKIEEYLVVEKVKVNLYQGEEVGQDAIKTRELNDLSGNLELLFESLKAGKNYTAQVKLQGRIAGEDELKVLYKGVATSGLVSADSVASIDVKVKPLPAQSLTVEVNPDANVSQVNLRLPGTEQKVAKEYTDSAYFEQGRDDLNLKPARWIIEVILESGSSETKGIRLLPTEKKKVSLMVSEDDQFNRLKVNLEQEENIEIKKAMLHLSNDNSNEYYWRKMNQVDEFSEEFSDLKEGEWTIKLWFLDGETGVYHLLEETKSEILADENKTIDMQLTKNNYDEIINSYNSLEKNIEFENNLQHIISRTTAKVLDVSGASREKQANVTVWQNNGGHHQYWKINSLTDGNYQIINDNSNQALEIEDASTEDGANVVQFPYEDGWEHQQWKIIHSEEEYYYLLNSNSNKVLSVAEDNNVVQRYYNEGQNQQFSFSSSESEAPTEKVVDVTDYGAESGKQECQAAAFDSAMEDVYENGGGTVKVPAGEYYFVKSIRFYKGVNLIGEGIGKSVLRRNDGTSYFLNRTTGSNMNIEVSKLTFTNPGRLLLLSGVSNMTFTQVEFVNGLVRFEESSHITIDSSRFKDSDTERGAYASNVADNMTLTNNEIINPTGGGFNLSRHDDSYVAHNTIRSEQRIYSGYAGIRLPNGASNNTVEDNTIIRTGRGIFVLSGSDHNTVRNNEVYDTGHQGIFVQSPHNIIADNFIKNIGEESIYVGVTTGNLVENNQITDSRHHGGDRYIGLKIYGQDNEVIDNTVSSEYNRNFKEISDGNTDRGNIYE